MADARAIELIQEERFDEFNAYVAERQGVVDLTNAHLRSYDLRRCHLSKADLGGAYLRAADLRALDLSEANLYGASMKDARVSGTLFPESLSATEIMMSLTHGTRIRHAVS